jgi:hypothetical protein
MFRGELLLPWRNVSASETIGERQRDTIDSLAWAEELGATAVPRLAGGKPLRPVRSCIRSSIANLLESKDSPHRRRAAAAQDPDVRFSNDLPLRDCSPVSRHCLLIKNRALKQICRAS